MSEDLDQQIASAAAGLPGLKVDLGDFKARAQKAGPDVNVADLLLAWASLKGDRAALVEMERRLLRVARPLLPRFGDEAFADDVLQDIRHRLLVGPDAKLHAYSGRGALVQYLKAVISSGAIDRVRKKNDQPNHEEDELLNVASETRSAESKVFQKAGKAQFSKAFSEALKKLTDQERLLLRMKYVENVPPEDIGRMFQVHRTTALRWIEKIQRELLETTRENLKAQLGVKGRELSSIMRELELSVSERLSRILPALKK